MFFYIIFLLYGSFSENCFIFTVPYVKIKFFYSQKMYDKMYGMECSDKLPKYKAEQQSIKIVAFIVCWRWTVYRERERKMGCAFSSEK